MNDAAVPPPQSPAGSRWGAALAIIGTQALFAIAGAGVWILSGRQPADFVRFDASAAAWGVLLALVLIAIAATLWCMFPQAGERLIRMQGETYSMLGRAPSLVMIVAISLAAGVGEEAAIRGGLQTILVDRLGPAPAIFLASLAFALLHMSHKVVMALIFLIGLLLGTIYHATGSLLTVMIGHALYDVWALRYLFRELRRLADR